MFTMTNGDTNIKVEVVLLQGHTTCVEYLHHGITSQMFLSVSQLVS
jgi:hypothetical protein